MSRRSTERAGAPTIELVGLTKLYGDTLALRDVDLTAQAGELLVLLGPSGCGKSTALKVIAGLEDASAGEVYIQGRLVNYVQPAKRNVAMVFQNYALYPHMTTQQNIGFPLKMAGLSKRQVADKVDEAVRLLELGPELHKYPGQLSGGQRQRVALGRALVREPIAFLMDEPLSNLDALLRVQMREELLNLHRRLNRTMIYVTHDQLEAMTMADRIVVIRQGMVQQIGAPEDVYARPANTFVARFVGVPQMSLFSGRLARRDGHATFRSGFEVPLSDRVELAEGAELTLGVRPEDVWLTGQGEPGGIPAAVTHVEPAGADTYLRVELPGRVRCAVRLSGITSVAPEERVEVTFSPERLHLFGPEGDRLEPDRRASPVRP